MSKVKENEKFGVLIVLEFVSKEWNLIKLKNGMQNIHYSMKKLFLGKNKKGVDKQPQQCYNKYR